MASEIELKLAIRPEDIRRIALLPAIAAAKSGPARKVRLAATYYDTPDKSLLRAGITVRVRSEGRGHTQTVKTAGTRVAGLFTRGEWEEPLASSVLDTSLLGATGLPPLQDKAVIAALRPLFTTMVNRTIIRLAGPDWEAELALDKGFVAAGETQQDIAEAELELVRGQHSTLYEMARTIAEAVPARLLTVSKSDRGHELASGKSPEPVKSKPVELTATTPAGQAFTAIAGNCLHQVLANERCLLATGDPEAIHQMRVALRRLRSAIKIFRAIVAGPQLETAREEIAWLLSHLGPARDSHVFLSSIPEDPNTRELREYWTAIAESDHRKALEAIGSQRFTILMLDLGAWAAAGDWVRADCPGRDAPLAPLAAMVLTKCRKRLRKAGGRKLADLTPEDLHRVRILGKQMRYAGEFFAPLTPGKAATRFLTETARLQNLLGEINDIAVAAARLDTLRGNPALAWSAGVLNGWNLACRPALLSNAAKAWKGWRKLRKYWD